MGKDGQGRRAQVGGVKTGRGWCENAPASSAGVISDEKIAALVNEHFDLRPKGIIQMLNLLRPIYEKTAAYGHFGRDEPEFTWEATDKAQALRAAAGLK